MCDNAVVGNICCQDLIFISWWKLDIHWATGPFLFSLLDIRICWWSLDHIKTTFVPTVAVPLCCLKFFELHGMKSICFTKKKPDFIWFPRFDFWEIKVEDGHCALVHATVYVCLHNLGRRINNNESRINKSESLCLGELLRFSFT